MIGGPGSPEGAPQTDPTKKEETGELTPPAVPAEVNPNAVRAAEALSTTTIPETGVQAGQAEVKLQPATDLTPAPTSEMSPAPVESKVPTAEPNLVPQTEVPEQGKKGGFWSFLGGKKKSPKNPESPEAQGGKE